ncbi:sensor domain-containing diguanylate cyclase [Larsenimonas suaedae]|uniref:diguanylate cyclase n=1 Tax=Larsenimonas suaedae TaxID=1851019 RepID=A0ABU1GUB0_9GAMM|nr:diguanylate cyclase [Larsenimonas suaedae]MCM2972017.1 diguanylate cyclase [Larsenimonas suaedae]MDR5895569.1 diguanylate cyclase [Larsenimonas suaedae]
MNRWAHQLRRNYLLLFITLMASGMLALYILYATLVRPILLELSTEHLERAQGHVEQMVDMTHRHLSDITADWSTWEQTWHYLRGDDPTFFDKQLGPTTFTHLSISALGFATPDGQIKRILVHLPGSESICTDESTACTPASSIFKRLDAVKSHYLGRLKGRFILDGTPRYMLSFQQVQDSYQQRESAGYLFMLKPLDHAWASALSAQLGVELRLIDHQSVTPVTHEFTLPTVPETASPWLDINDSTTDWHRNIDTFNLALWLLMGLVAVLLTLMATITHATLLRPLLNTLAFLDRSDTQTPWSVTPPQRMDALTQDITRRVSTLAEQEYNRGKHRSADEMVDPTTRLLTRSSLLDRLPTLLSISEQYYQSVTCILVEVDFFDAFQAKFGAERTETLLKALAASLSEVARSRNDLMARMGQHQFALVLPGTLHSEAHDVAARLTSSIKRKDLANPLSPLSERLTISQGVAISTPQHPLPARALVQRAEDALTRAQHQGRDMTCGFEQRS